MAIPNFPELEEQILQEWRDKNIFEKTLAKSSPQGNFVFYDGPPFANGKPHIGHVETRAFKDIIPRFKTMQGFHVDRKAGWDTHGLAVEIEIEKELGLAGKKDIEKYGVAKFNAKAKESVWKYQDLWEKMTERVGFWLDLKHPYITYSSEYIESLWWVFKQIWDQKLLVQDYKVVPYCPRCGTALSSHEVAQGYENVEEQSVYIKFELVDEPGTFVLAWTTTPWTLPGNVALAVDPKISYVRVRSGDEQLLFAEARMKDLGFTEEDIVAKSSGQALVGKSYKPLFDFVDLRNVDSTAPAQRATPPAPGGEHKNAYTIVPADFVTTSDGTGVVHTAVMYGEDDFQLGTKLDLPKVHTVDLQGKFTDLVKPWVGLEVRGEKGETQQKIIAWLEEHGKLHKVESYKHDYPFCWRCKHALLYYAKTSWFIQMSKLRNELMKNNEKINWYPNHIKDGRFGEWLREVKDWAISRERYWGTPLPIWECDQCKHQECLGGYQELIERLPTRNRYIFVRHGESLNNVQNLVNSDAATSQKYPLTPEGQRQAETLAKKLQSMEPSVVFSSPFLRTKQTAEAIAALAGSSVQIDDRVGEFKTGYDEKSHDTYRAFSSTIDRFTEAPENGETFLDLRSRLYSFLHEVDQQHEDQTIVVVTHADPILVVEWAAGLQSQSQFVPRKWVDQGGWKEIKLPMQLLQPDGSFDPHRPFIDNVAWKCTKCDTGAMHRIPEVADVWFDSGAMPLAQLHYPFENKEKVETGQAYPADYISEAIDQTRGWFYTLLAISTLLQKAKVIKPSSYQNVVVLGHLNDAKGKKLSKRLKNYGDLNELFDKHGADALRWFMYTVNQPWDTKNFDPKIVDEGVKKTFLILMNVVSFYKLSQATNPRIIDESTNVEKAAHPLDRWIHSMVNSLTQDVTERLEKYDITGAARAIGAFVTDLSTWYVRRSRDRFKGEEAPLASAMLAHVLLKLSKLMAPFTPFLAEQVYRQTGGKMESVHLEDWPTVEQREEQLLKDMAIVRTLVEQGHALRAQAKVKVRQPLQQFVIKPTLPVPLIEILRSELNVKEIHEAEVLPTGHEWVTTDQTALDTTITDELRAEGLLRDLIREFNALRKTAKLKPSDQIIAHVQPNTPVAKVIEVFHQEFLRDIRAKAVTPSLDDATHTATVALDIGEVIIGISGF